MISRNKLMLLFLLIALFIGNQNAFSQTSREDLRKLNSTYSDANSFSMNIQVQLFENQEDVKPAASYIGLVKKQGDNFFTEILNQITVKNKNCLLTIDKNLKRIVYKPTQKNKNETVDSDPGKTIDSLIKTYKSVTLVSSTATNRTYALTSNSSKCIYEKVLLTIDTRQFTLLCVEYYYKFKSTYNLILIKYSNITLNQSIPETWFATNKYIKINNNVISPTDLYKGYKVVKINNNFIINN